MFVKDSPVEAPDFIASIYYKLGIDYGKEYVSNIGRPIKLAGDGKPLAFLYLTSKSAGNNISLSLPS